MNPFVLLGLGAVAAGLIIELVMKEKQEDETVDEVDPDDPPVVTVESSDAEIRDSGASRVDDSADSGDISASEVPTNSGNRSIDLDS